MRTLTNARALAFVAPRQVTIEPVQLPELGAGDVLVRVLSSGISAGTEMLAYRGQLEPGLALDDWAAELDELGGRFLRLLIVLGEDDQLVSCSHVERSLEVNVVLVIANLERHVVARR